MTKENLNNLREEVTNLILCNLKDYEPCETVVDFQDEVFDVFESIAEMIERWDEYAEEYREATGTCDNSDHEYELEVGK
jgi:hypothetical protein